MHPKRPRLDPALYVGLQRYFLTFCTSRRESHFVDRKIVDAVLAQILQTGWTFDIEVIVYCFMPDHLHVLVEGCTDAADLMAFVHQAKQRSAYVFSREWRRRLWQPSYYDRVLRDADATMSVARYILENPVRKELVQSPAEYPYLGAVRFTIEQVLEAACWQP